MEMQGNASPAHNPRHSVPRHSPLHGVLAGACLLRHQHEPGLFCKPVGVSVAWAAVAVSVACVASDKYNVQPNQRASDTSQLLKI